MSYRKVLIIRLSALGDVAMTIPVVYSVCRAYPETTFVMLRPKSGFTIVHKRSEKFTGCRRRCQGKAQGLCRALSSGSGRFVSCSFDAVADLHDVLRTKVLRFFFKMRMGIRVAVIDKGRKERQELTSRRAKVLRPLRSLFRTVRRGFCFARG